MSDREREVATKYLSFLQARRGLKRDPSLLSLTPADQPLSPSGEPPSGHAHHHALPSPCHDGQSFPPHASAYCADPAPAVSDGKPLSLSATAFCRGSLFIVCFFWAAVGSLSAAGTAPACVYVADVEEVRVSPVVSRRGMLSVLEKGALGWVRRWVVVRRPYVFLYKVLDLFDPQSFVI